MWILRTRICNAQNNEVVPQVAHMGDGYAWDAPDSLTRIRANAPLAFRPNLRAFHLDPATNLTDVVSQGYVYTAGLLVSAAFYRVLRGFAVQAHEAYPAEVVHHGQSRDYVWVHMTESVEERIDFANSEFAVRDHLQRETPVAFAGHHELREKARELVNTIGPLELLAKRIVFPAEAPRYDLFAVRLTDLLFLASDRLAGELRRHRFTGFELEPAGPVVRFG